MRKLHLAKNFGNIPPLISHAESISGPNSLTFYSRSATTVLTFGVFFVFSFFRNFLHKDSLFLLSQTYLNSLCGYLSFFSWPLNHFLSSSYIKSASFLPFFNRFLCFSTTSAKLKVFFRIPKLYRIYLVGCTQS